MDRKIGKLDTLVQLYEPTKTLGPQGENIITYQEKGKILASIVVSINEQNADENLNQNYDLTIRSYKRRHITTRWRAAIDGCMYEIVEMSPEERLSPFTTIELRRL